MTNVYYIKDFGTDLYYNPKTKSWGIDKIAMSFERAYKFYLEFNEKNGQRTIGMEVVSKDE